MRTSRVSMRAESGVYLIDTNVISEARKGRSANPGVRTFLKQCAEQGEPLYLSVITVGELRRGVELIRRRGDTRQAVLLEAWLRQILEDYRDLILPFDIEMADLWGRLRVPHPENALDKQIAATALLYDLTLVTRNTADFVSTGVRVRDPFV